MEEELKKKLENLTKGEVNPLIEKLKLKKLIKEAREEAERRFVKSSLRNDNYSMLQRKKGWLQCLEFINKLNELKSK